MKKYCYHWVELNRETEEGTLIRYCWIPDKYAILGKYIKLQEDGIWSEDSWLVVYVASVRMDEKVLLALNKRADTWDTQ